MAVSVKVCGLRRAEDATVAIEAGATYLGVVYAGGPRTVTDRGARGIVEVSGEVPVLAVWGSPDLDAILRARDAARFHGVQLHGGGDRSLVDALRSHGLIVWRVARLAGPADLELLPTLCEGGDALLVEPRVPGREGGAGVALDLELALSAKERFESTTHPRSTTHDARRTRFALAGGLRPETVAAAICAVRPDIVDVSSGVESAPGVKDPHLIRTFLEQALADHSSP